MRKFSEYNKAKYIALLFSVTLLGGSSFGVLGKVLDIHFFQVDILHLIDIVALFITGTESE